jgi:hypothetical protein
MLHLESNSRVYLETREIMVDKVKRDSDTHLEMRPGNQKMEVQHRGSKTLWLFVFVAFLTFRTHDIEFFQNLHC